MYKKNTCNNISMVRLMTLEQASNYTGMGRTACSKWCKEIGAFRKIGAMARYDRVVIDAALDALEQAEVAEAVTAEAVRQREV